jgi:hypothetical protein
VSIRVSIRVSKPDFSLTEQGGLADRDANCGSEQATRRLCIASPVGERVTRYKPTQVRLMALQRIEKRKARAVRLDATQHIQRLEV